MSTHTYEAELTIKTAARLEAGDRVILTPPTQDHPDQVRRIHTVDHTRRMPNGIVRVFYGRYGMMHVDAAGAHRFELAHASEQPHRANGCTPDHNDPEFCAAHEDGMFQAGEMVCNEAPDLTKGTSR